MFGAVCASGAMEVVAVIKMVALVGSVLDALHSETSCPEPIVISFGKIPGLPFELSAAWFFWLCFGGPLDSFLPLQCPQLWPAGRCKEARHNARSSPAHFIHHVVILILAATIPTSSSSSSPLGTTGTGLRLAPAVKSLESAGAGTFSFITLNTIASATLPHPKTSSTPPPLISSSLPNTEGVSSSPPRAESSFPLFDPGSSGNKLVLKDVN